MILVFALVFIFIWSYLKKFPNPNRLKIIFAVTVFSILASLLVSSLSVYGAWYRNPVLESLSMPFFLDILWGISVGLWDGSVWFRIFLAGVQLSEAEFHYKTAGRGPMPYLYSGLQWDVDLTAIVLFQYVIVFTALNMVGVVLAVIAYKLKQQFIR